MQIRTVFPPLILGLLLATTARAATPVPVTIRIVDPGAVFLSCIGGSGFVEIELPLAPTVDWTLPGECGTGSGTIEPSVDENGAFHAGGSGSMEKDSQAIVDVGRRLRIEIDVPDFGESMTPLTLMRRGATFEAASTTNGYWSAGADIRFYQRQSATLGLGSDDSVSLNSRETVGTNVIHDIGLVGFIAGDTVTVDVSVAHRVECSAATFGDPCSVSWTQSPDFQILAIAPEPQNRPQTQCFDQADNDGDGLIDLADPNCNDPYDTTESPPPPPLPGWGCGLGPELALLLPALWSLRRNRPSEA